MTIIAATPATDLTYAVAEMLHDALGDTIDDFEFAELVDETVANILAGVSPTPEAA